MQNQKYKIPFPKSAIFRQISEIFRPLTNIWISDFQVNIRKSDIPIIIVALGLILPNFGLAQTDLGVAMPQTLGDGKDFIMGILKELPEAIKRVWHEEALPIWQRMWIWFSGFWDKTIGPVVESWWHKFLGFLGKEVEERRPGIEEEFQKETEEMQKDLWERFKDLFR